MLMATSQHEVADGGEAWGRILWKPVERHLAICQSCSEAHRLSSPVPERVPALRSRRWSRGRDLPRCVPNWLRNQKCSFGRQPGACGFAAEATSAAAEALPRNLPRRLSPMVGRRAVASSPFDLADL